jgi:phosphomannomutase
MSSIALFDLDGTLSEPRQKCLPSMLEFIEKLRRVTTVGIVSGSDLSKINDQLGCDATKIVDFVFAENGVQGWYLGEPICSMSIAQELGEENLKTLVNFVLHYIADLDIPIKRGTFIEYRRGMLNFSPIGRNCSLEERLAFNEYDNVHGVRKAMQKALTEKFGDSMNLQFSIGGQISLDCFIRGWDKRFCLDYVKEYDQIHFFGDRTDPGGNDHEIFADPRTIGHAVTSPNDTISQCTAIFMSDKL